MTCREINSRLRMPCSLLLRPRRGTLRSCRTGRWKGIARVSLEHRRADLLLPARDLRGNGPRRRVVHEPRRYVTNG